MAYLDKNLGVWGKKEEINRSSVSIWILSDLFTILPAGLE